jgi:hypothetical protein
VHKQIYGGETTIENVGDPENEDQTDEMVGEVDEGTPATPPAPKAEEKVDWEHKYKTLQGMYNSEVPKLQGQLRKLEGEKEGLENIIATMSTTPVTSTSSPTKLVTDEEVADWGPEMTDYFRRVAQEQYGPIVEELRAENQKLQNQNLQLQKSVGSVEADRSANGRSQLLIELANAVPDWQEVNQSVDFLGWLEQPDAFSGRARHDLLLEAYEANDTPRVIAFFKSFKRDKAVVSETPPPAAPAEPTVRLDSLVAPGKAPSTTTQPPSDTDSNQRVWAQSEIQQFYRDVQRGVYRGKEAETARIESAIVKAGREGRVR